MEFVNCHCHSSYSIRDSISKIPDLVSRAVELGMPAVALTDHGTTGGLMSLYKESKKKNIKPILGVELYVAPGSRSDKLSKHRYDHLTVIAMNNTGWKNMCTLVNESNKPENYYYKPRVDRELLRLYNEGLIILSGCLASHLAKAILKERRLNFEDEDGQNAVECMDTQQDNQTSTIMSIRETIEWYKGVFGDRYYLEIQNHGIPEETEVRNAILNIGNDFDVKVVATGDSHFVNEEDLQTHNIMIATRDRTTLLDEKLKKYPGSGYHLPTEELLRERFGDYWEAVTNTMEIVERCNVKLNLGNYIIPRPKGITIRNEDNVFVTQAMEGLSRRFNGSIPPEYVTRLETEIDTIIKMTFPSYFLMVQDYMQWAKSQGILTSPSRGSAGGSLVSYALGITEVDPIKYDLSFARFLNKGRSSIPKIDFPEFPLSAFTQGAQS